MEVGAEDSKNELQRSIPENGDLSHKPCPVELYQELLAYCQAHEKEDYLIKKPVENPFKKKRCCYLV